MTQLFLQSSHIIFSLASESRQQFDTKTKMLFGRRKMPQTAKGNRFSENRCQDSYNATNTRLTVTREIIAKLWCKQCANIPKCSDPNSKMTPGIRNCTGKTVLLKQNVWIPGSIAPKDLGISMECRTNKNSHMFHTQRFFCTSMLSVLEIQTAKPFESCKSISLDCRSFL